MAKNLDVQVDSAEIMDNICPILPPPAASSNVKQEATIPTDISTERRKGTKGENRKKTAATCLIPPIENEEDYLELFIRESETAARAGKMAYVRKDFHDRIMRITRVIGKGKLSLSGYIDHVLAQHFLQCGDVIKKLYNENYEDVF